MLKLNSVNLFNEFVGKGEINGSKVSSVQNEGFISFAPDKCESVILNVFKFLQCLNISKLKHFPPCFNQRCIKLFLFLIKTSFTALDNVGIYSFVRRIFKELIAG